MKPNDEPSTTEDVLPTWDVAPPPTPATPPMRAAGGSAGAARGNADGRSPQSRRTDASRRRAARKPPCRAKPTTAGPRSPADGRSRCRAVAVAALAGEPTSPPAPIVCPVCGAPRKGDEPSCDDCGYYFSPADLAPASRPRASAATPHRERLTAAVCKTASRSARSSASVRGVTRYRGLDHGDGADRRSRSSSCVSSCRAGRAAAGRSRCRDVAVAEPTRTSPARLRRRVPDGHRPITEILPRQPRWPSLAWEQGLLTTLEHPGLPRVARSFHRGRLRVPGRGSAGGRSRSGTPGTIRTPTPSSATASSPRSPRRCTRLHQCRRHPRRACGPTSSSITPEGQCSPHRPVRPAAAAAAGRRAGARHAVHRAGADPGRQAPTPAPICTASAPCSTRCTSAATSNEKDFERPGHAQAVHPALSRRPSRRSAG